MLWFILALRGKQLSELQKTSRLAQFPSTFIQVAGINAISLGSSTLHCAVPIRSMLCPLAGLAASMVIPEASAKRSILLLMTEKRQEDASRFRRPLFHETYMFFWRKELNSSIYIYIWMVTLNRTYPKTWKNCWSWSFKKNSFSVEVKSQHCLSFTTAGEETELMTFDIHCMEFLDFQN